MSKPTTAPSSETDLRLELTAKIIQDRVAAGLKLPLEVLFDTMDTYITQQNHSSAAMVAAQAAPYVHPKLKDFVLSGSVANTSSMQFDLVNLLKGKLTVKEMLQMEALLKKANS